MTPKFRVWDRLTGKMFPVGIIDYSIQSVYIEEPNEMYCERDFDDVELMQYTGLKDKNGKEIFEGDIVKYKLGGDTFTDIVAYNNWRACFYLKDDTGDALCSFDYLLEDVRLDNIEVVGNEFEKLG